MNPDRPYTPWIAGSWSSSDPPRLRLFCIPQAGGSAADFSGWQRLLPDVEVCAIQPPGRQDRFRERALTSVRELACAIAQVVSCTNTVPFAIVGHCSGSLIAFETAREIRRGGDPMPLAIVVSCYRAPHRPVREGQIHRLPDAELMATVRDRRLVPAAAVASDELMRLLLPMLRADYAAIETHVHTDEPPLDVPVWVFHSGEPMPPMEDLEEWAAHTSEGCMLAELPGPGRSLHASPALVAAVASAVANVETTGR